MGGRGIQHEQNYYIYITRERERTTSTGHHHHHHHNHHHHHHHHHLQNQASHEVMNHVSLSVELVLARVLLVGNGNCLPPSQYLAEGNMSGSGGGEAGGLGRWRRGRSGGSGGGGGGGGSVRLRPCLLLLSSTLYIHSSLPMELTQEAAVPRAGLGRAGQGGAGWDGTRAGVMH